MRRIDPHSLIPMDVFKDEPIKTDIVYANGSHPENIFGINAYHPQARMILHRDLARIVISAARLLHNRDGWTLILKDGLRPVEAQERQMNTDIVRANPQWLKEPRLLSPPGMGAHPRGMAIDVAAEDSNGVPVDMGTVFDTMTEKSARAFADFPQNILQNRKILEHAFTDAATLLGLPLVPLASEWWDFRLSRAHYDDFAPISDDDLPDNFKICRERREDTDHEREHLTRLAKEIAASV